MVRLVQPADAGAWLVMRIALWPEGTAESHGCTEFASDALLDNLDSAAAHEALGFRETVQIRCFRKDLGKTHR